MYLNPILKVLIVFQLLSTFNFLFAEELTIGVRAHRGADYALERWSPTIEYLQKKLPQHQFSLVPLEKIEDMEKLVEEERLDFVITQPVAYVDLERQYQVTRLLTLEKQNAISQFGSVIFTHSDHTHLNSLKDIDGKTIAGVAKKGFGGWLIGYNEIVNSGLSYDNFKSVQYLGDQYKVVDAVSKKEIDVGIVRTGILERMVKENRLDLEKIKVLNQINNPDFPYILSTKLFPEWAFAKTPQTNLDSAREVAIALLSIPENSDITIKGQYARWITPLSYNSVHNLMRQLKIGSYSDFGKVTLLGFLEQHKLAVGLTSLIIALLVVYLVGITSLKNRLYESEQLLKQAQKLAKLGHWHLDLVKNKLSWSDETFRIFEINPNEFKASYEAFVEAIHPEDKEKVDAAYKESMNNKAPYNIEHRLLMKDGRIKYVTEQGHTVFDDNGKALSSMGTVLDITDRKIIEQKLEKSQQDLMELNQSLELAVQERTKDLEEAKNAAEAANMAKSTFLAKMSHELRTPMHAIMSFTNLAIKRSEDEKQEHFLDNIKSSSLRLTNLLNDLLDLSKLQAGKMQVDFSTHDLAKLVIKTIEEMDSLLKDKSISVNSDHLDKEFECMFDQKLIAQVLVNLFSNAIKFSPENSSIDIEISRRELELNGIQQQILEVSVIDQGVGIPSDQLESIFEQFEQSSTTKNLIEGTGLGLQITRQIIELHHGRVWAESPPSGLENGSVFYFQIPIAQTDSKV